MDKSYNPTLNSTVPIMYNYTGIQGRSNFLVEYHGEGSAHTSSDSCAGHLNHDLDNLSQCSDQFGCKCQDSRNNTYTCIRTIGQEDTMFCQFQDRDNFLEMYNLMQDPEQIINLASLLSSETINYYKVKYSNFIKVFQFFFFRNKYLTYWNVREKTAIVPSNICYYCWYRDIQIRIFIKTSWGK